MPKVSQARKDAMRQRIIDAAYVCMVEGDYAPLTTRSVIERAGISNGALYHYFPSMEHLYAALAEHQLDLAMTGIAERAGSNPELFGTGLLEWVVRDLLGDAKLGAAVATVRSQIRTGLHGRELMETLDRFVVDSFGDLVRQLQASGTFRHDLDADALVEMVDFLWDGLGRRMASGSFQTSHERVVSTITEVLLGGVLDQSRQDAPEAG